MAVIMLVALGCSGNGKESLEKYENIITEEDIREIIYYSGIIDRSCNENTQNGVHLSFGTEGFLSRDMDAESIFTLHVEHMFPKEKELINDMQGSEPLADIGDLAWYSEASNGYISLIFYIRDTNIIVEMGCYNGESNHDPSILIDKESLIQLAQVIERRL
jgi:hypothetical protein